MQLHELALTYWAEERPADALRIERHARDLVRGLDQPQPLLVDIAATIEAVTRELHE